MIKTVSESQEEILLNILKLYKIDRFEIDPCYSKGNFYKGEVPEPAHAFDIEPKDPDIIQSDARDLPFIMNSVESIIFDPPFLATKGPSLRLADASNQILKRFSVFPTEPELFKFYWQCLQHFYDILMPKGFLIVKCQDKVSSGKQYFSHIYIHNMAMELGFYPKDLFVLHNKSKMIGKWGGNQVHAWKTNSFFWVFKKRNAKVDLNKLLEN